MVRQSMALTGLLLVVVVVALVTAQSGASKRQKILRALLKKLRNVGGNRGSSSSSSCPESCQRIYLPVCGSNGQTYNNKCVLEVANCRSLRDNRGPITATREGACDLTQSCQRDCSGIYSPICGNNGVTYGNECWLTVAKCLDPDVRQSSKGECGGREAAVSVASRKCREECTKIYLPVCGTDGSSYNNKCLLEAASCLSTQAGKEAIGLAHDGLCEIPDRCRKDCAKNYDPRCANNGITYGNACWLSIARCLNPDVSEQHTGECSRRESSNCEERCTKIYTPVCGTDGRSYNNKCILEAASCRSVRDGQGTIRLAHEGFCAEHRQCQRNCSLAYQPVCATSGVTFDNGCLFSIAKCLDNNISLDYDGVCVATEAPVCTNPCPSTDDPVCGSDGSTYRNQCLLMKQACSNQGLLRLYKGQCQGHQ